MTYQYPLTQLLLQRLQRFCVAETTTIETMLLASTEIDGRSDIMRSLNILSDVQSDLSSITREIIDA